MGDVAAVGPGGMCNGVTESSLRLFVHRFAGQATEHIESRQAIGDGIHFTATRDGRAIRLRDDTLDAQGRLLVPARDGVSITVFDTAFDTMRVDPPEGNDLAACLERLGYLGYVAPAFVNEVRADGYLTGSRDDGGRVTSRIALTDAKRVYDFQADHGIHPTGKFDDETRDRIIEVFDTALCATEED